MSKGTTTMSVIAVLVTGGYFGYDYWHTRKEAKSAAQGAPGSGARNGSGSGSDPARDDEKAARNAYRAEHPPGSGSEGAAHGSGSGSGAGAEEVTHTVQSLRVPNIVGLAPDQATAALVALGYEPTVLEMPANLMCRYEDEQRDIVPVGTICNQQREPGDVLMSNAKLRVVVEKDTWEHGGVEADNEWRRMPKLEGLPLARAQALLRSQGFGDDEFAVGEARTGCGAGVICEQRPKANGRKYLRERGELNVSD